MKVVTEKFGELDFSYTKYGWYEAEAHIEGIDVEIQLEWEDEESESLRQALTTLSGELRALWEAGAAALVADLATSTADYGVAYYAEFHVEELSEEILLKVVGSRSPTAQDFLPHLHLRRISVDPENDSGRYTLDYSIDTDVTDQLLCVRLNSQRSDPEVVVES